MAAFRIRDTANRIGVLADRAQDPALRRDLHALRERLLNEERALRSAEALRGAAGDIAMSDPQARLSGEDLTFWWLDSPAQPTTMAMLMVLDREPDLDRLRSAFEAAVAAVPRLAQRVRDAPLDLTLPHWEDDPTFDLDYHFRLHASLRRGRHGRAAARNRARVRDPVRSLAAALGGAPVSRPRPWPAAPRCSSSSTTPWPTASGPTPSLPP